jgi:CRP-like cAMP-binding protein
LAIDVREAKRGAIMTTRNEIRRKLDSKAFLEAPGGPLRTVVNYCPGEVIFAQGDPCNTVMYIQKGDVRLSVFSRPRTEGIVGTLTAGSFLGEDALAGRSVRLETATALTSSAVLVVSKQEMIRLLQTQPELSYRFITHTLARNTRLERNLADQLFDPSEKRLARTLLLLAGYDQPNTPSRVLPSLSQAVLADMAGTTRPRVASFMKKFERLGFIAYDGRLTIVNKSLLRVVAHQ